jgi:hypothetical protein
VEAIGRGELRGTPLAPQHFRGDKPLEGGSAVPALRYSRVSSSELGTGSREENAIKSKRQSIRSHSVESKKMLSSPLRWRPAEIRPWLPSVSHFRGAVQQSDSRCCNRRSSRVDRDRKPSGFSGGSDRSFRIEVIHPDVLPAFHLGLALEHPKRCRSGGGACASSILHRLLPGCHLQQEFLDRL